jgi:hypothetical protein
MSSIHLQELIMWLNLFRRSFYGLANVSLTFLQVAPTPDFPSSALNAFPWLIDRGKAFCAFDSEPAFLCLTQSPFLESQIARNNPTRLQIRTYPKPKDPRENNIYPNASTTQSNFYIAIVYYIKQKLYEPECQTKPDILGTCNAG